MPNDTIVASRTDCQVLLRVPKPLLQRLDRATRQSKRSRNSEILCRLSKSLEAGTVNAAGAQG
jgi:hypothetical protein